MTTGQTLLTFGAMMLLSMILLRINITFLSTNIILYASKFIILATSLAISYIEEATGKAFDANTVSGTVTSTASLSTIGKETGEVYPDFDDFDDFHNYTHNTASDSTIQSAIYDISCTVQYVIPSNPNGSSGSKTWHKKLTVTVTSESMADTVVLSTIYSYFKFR